MKKIILFLIILNTSTIFSQSKNDQLFFVSGHPFKDEIEKMDELITSKLFAVKTDSLFLVQNFGNNQCYNNNIRLYFDERMLIIRNRKKNEDSTFVIIINFDNPLRQNIIGIPSSETVCLRNWFIKDQQGMYLFLDCVDEKLKSSPNLINLNTFQRSKVDDSLLNYIVTYGSGGIGIMGSDFLNLEYLNDKLVIPSLTYTGKSTNYIYQIPDSLRKYAKNIQLIVNNQKYLILIVYSSTSKKEIIGWKNILAFNKKNNEWLIFKLNGNCTKIRHFGNRWIGGTISDDNELLIVDSITHELKKRIEFDRVSPGKEYRKKNDSLNVTADEKFKYLKIYCPGILYLFNLDTKRYIEWETLEEGKLQGDSEILLIENEIVYYRINDKIFKVSIINGKSLGKSEFLLKDPRVPDIHWAFISKN